MLAQQMQLMYFYFTATFEVKALSGFRRENKCNRRLLSTAYRVLLNSFVSCFQGTYAKERNPAYQKCQSSTEAFCELRPCQAQKNLGRYLGTNHVCSYLKNKLMSFSFTYLLAHTQLRCVYTEFIHRTSLSRQG